MPSSTKQELEKRIKDHKLTYSSMYKEIDRNLGARGPTGNFLIPDEHFKRSFFFEVDPLSRVAKTEPKNLNDFYNELLNMPLEQADKALDDYDEGVKNRKISAFEIHPYKNCVTALEETNYALKSLYCDRMVKQEKEYDEFNKRSPRTEPKDLNFFQKLWNLIHQKIWDEPSPAAKKYEAAYNEYRAYVNKKNDLGELISKHGVSLDVVKKANDVLIEKNLDLANFAGEISKELTNYNDGVKKEILTSWDNVKEDEILNVRYDLEGPVPYNPSKEINQEIVKNRFDKVFGLGKNEADLRESGFDIKPDLYKDVPKFSSNNRDDYNVDSYIKLLCALSVNSNRVESANLGKTSGELINKKFNLPQSYKSSDNNTKNAYTTTLIMDELLTKDANPESSEFVNAILADGAELYKEAIKNPAVLEEVITNGIVNIMASLETAAPEDFVNTESNVALKMQAIDAGKNVLDERGLHLKIDEASPKAESMGKWFQISDVFDSSRVSKNDIASNNKNGQDAKTNYNYIMLEGSIRAMLAQNAKIFQDKQPKISNEQERAVNKAILRSNPVFDKVNTDINLKSGNDYYNVGPSSNSIKATITEENINKLKETVVDAKMLDSIKTHDQAKKLVDMNYASHVKNMYEALNSEHEKSEMDKSAALIKNNQRINKKNSNQKTM